MESFTSLKCVIKQDVLERDISISIKRTIASFGHLICLQRTCLINMKEGGNNAIPLKVFHYFVVVEFLVIN